MNNHVVYIVSNIDKASAFEWIASCLPSKGLKLSFILLNPSHSVLEDFLLKSNIPVHAFSQTGIKDYPKCLATLFFILRDLKPNVIHCHLFHASLLGLFAGWVLGIRIRVYTRHHSTYNHEYNRKGVWIDRMINALATDIVAISQNVKNVLTKREKINQQKISLIQHGFDLDQFIGVPNGRIEILQKKYNPDKRGPLIGIIARWMEWKGVQYIIPAYKNLLNDHPNALLILANASGLYKFEIEKLLQELPTDSYVIIPFENDLFALYQLFDVYVHTPVNPTIEAFGQTYVEALAAGIPSVFTLSGVAPEFIEHENNALVVPFVDSQAIYLALIRLLNDEKLRLRLIEKGKESVKQFSLKKMMSGLSRLYQNND